MGCLLLAKIQGWATPVQPATALTDSQATLHLPTDFHLRRYDSIFQLQIKPQTTVKSQQVIVSILYTGKLKKTEHKRDVKFKQILLNSFSIDISPSMQLTMQLLHRKQTPNQIKKFLAVSMPAL